MEGCPILHDEFRHLRRIHDALSASGNEILSPTPYEFCGPESDFWSDPTLRLPAVDRLKTCAFSMSRVYPIPIALKQKIIALFCPERLQRSKADKFFLRQGHHVARLLLGRAETDIGRSAPRLFFDTYNFPLTRARAEKLGIDTLRLAKEMGRLLAQFHMVAKCDARDIEIVLGANITNTLNRHREPRVWVIDFNQVRDFDLSESGISGLVNAFFENDAYFPRARVSESDASQPSLYPPFADAYLTECGKIGNVASELGQLFLKALEAEQIRRDTRVIST